MLIKNINKKTLTEKKKKRSCTRIISKQKVKWWPVTTFR